jgi:hypothetical protein
MRRQLMVAVHASAVLRRAGPLSAQQPGHAGGPDVAAHGLHGDEMLPVVAEVVDVAEAVALPEPEVAQQHRGVILLVLVELVVAEAVAGTADVEKVHVAVVPAHDELDDVDGRIQNRVQEGTPVQPGRCGR